jgi:hypothetical protein
MKKIINYLHSLINKPKKKLTLEEFLSSVKELAIADGKHYYTVQIELSEHNHRDNTFSKKIVFSSYIDGYNHCKGDTMEESLAKLKESMKTSKEQQVIQEVIIS